jgi:hypothetical protein
VSAAAEPRSARHLRMLPEVHALAHRCDHSRPASAGSARSATSDSSVTFASYESRVTPMMSAPSELHRRGWGASMPCFTIRQIGPTILLNSGQELSNYFPPVEMREWDLKGSLEDIIDAASRDPPPGRRRGGCET